MVRAPGEACGGDFSGNVGSRRGAVVVGTVGAAVGSAGVVVGSVGAAVGSAGLVVGAVGAAVGSAGVVVGAVGAAVGSAGLVVGSVGAAVGSAGVVVGAVGAAVGSAGLVVGSVGAAVGSAGLVVGSVGAAVGSAGLVVGSAGMIVGSAGAAVGVGSDAMAVPDGEHPAPAAPSNAMTTTAAIAEAPGLLDSIYPISSLIGERPDMDDLPYRVGVGVEPASPDTVSSSEATLFSTSPSLPLMAVNLVSVSPGSAVGAGVGVPKGGVGVPAGAVGDGVGVPSPAGGAHAGSPLSTLYSRVNVRLYGTQPVKSLLWSHSLSSVRLFRFSGIYPLRLLAETNSQVRLARLPISEGMVPESALVYSHSSSRLPSLPRSADIWPLSPFL